MWESQPCWVTSTSGANSRTQRRHDRVEGTQPAGVAGAGRQRHVDRRTLGVRPADVVREAGAGEQHLAGLVQRDRQHPRVVPEHPLDAVAVVDVDVDVRDPLGALVEQPLDADRDVVVDAEAAGPVGHRVVQAAGDVDAVQRSRRSTPGRHASTVAPTTCAAASCMPAKTGLSSVPRPCRSSSGAGRAGPPVTASTSAGSWTVASRSSSAHRRRDHAAARRRGRRAPRPAASSGRRGPATSGGSGPKS